MKIKQVCQKCGGKGHLPPLGFDGLAPDAPERRDVMRNCLRPCRPDDGGCDGVGWRMIDVSINEGGNVAVPASAVGSVNYPRHFGYFGMPAALGYSCGYPLFGRYRNTIVGHG